MPSLSRQPLVPAPRPLDAFAGAVTTEIGELEVAEGRYVEALGGAFAETADGVVVEHPTLSHPAFNGALHLTSSSRAFDAFIDGLEARFRARGSPFGVLTSPASQPYDVTDRLLRRGYWNAGPRVWMEVEETVPEHPHDARVEVHATQDAGLWASTVAGGVGLPAQVAFLRTLAQASREAPTHRLLVATFMGAPAGGCEVARNNAVAFVRHLGVLPAFRRQGIAHALLHRAFGVAEELKAVRLATRVIAGTDVDRLYERYGFVGSHVSELFVRSPPPFVFD